MAGQWVGALVLVFQHTMWDHRDKDLETPMPHVYTLHSHFDPVHFVTMKYGHHNYSCQNCQSQWYPTLADCMTHIHSIWPDWRELLLVDL